MFIAPTQEHNVPNPIIAKQICSTLNIVKMFLLSSSTLKNRAFIKQN